MTTHLERQISGIAEDLDNIVAGTGVEKFVHDYDCDDGEDYEELYARLNKYFADALDVEFIVSSNGTYRGAEIMLGCGGPNVYLDTRHGIVKGYWGTDKAFATLSRRAANEVDAYWESQWSCNY